MAMVELMNNFLHNHAVHEQVVLLTVVTEETPYVEKARIQTLLCRDRLAAHEFLIGRFYFKRKQYVAAADRFRVVLDRFPYYSRTEETLFRLGTCLLKTDNPSEARLYFERLVHDFPEGKFTPEARRILQVQGKG